MMHIDKKWTYYLLGVSVGVIAIGLIAIWTGTTKTTVTQQNTPITDESQVIDVDNVNVEEVEIATKPEDEKTVEELDTKASMLIEYKGEIKSFTQEGSRGYLEIITGEPNTENVETMLFTINLDNILYDAQKDTNIPPSEFVDGTEIMLYAVDNSVTSAITPIAIVKNVNKDLRLAVAEKVEKFEIKDFKVDLVTDKYSKDLIYIDDNTVIVNSFSGEPIKLADIKDTDKLFIKTGEHDDTKIETTMTKDENGKLVETEETKQIRDMYNKSKRAEHISVYKNIEE